MGVNNKQISATGISALKGIEKFRAKSYQDSRGVWTIGYGHTGKNVRSGQFITIETATRLLAADISWAAFSVNRRVTAPLTQNQFDALVLFVFNVGDPQFSRSTLLEKLNNGDYDLRSEFLRWDNSGHRHIDGLENRRKLEAALFERPDNAPVVSNV